MTHTSDKELLSSNKAGHNALNFLVTREKGKQRFLHRYMQSIKKKKKKKKKKWKENFSVTFPSANS